MSSVPFPEQAKTYRIEHNGDMESVATRGDIHELRREMHDGMRETRAEIKEIGSSLEAKLLDHAKEDDARFAPLEGMHARITLLGTIIALLIGTFGLTMTAWIARHW